MMDLVSVWQGLSHSPYVICFTSASAVCISDQSAPAEGLRVLNCTGFFPPFLFHIPVPHLYFFLYLSHTFGSPEQRTTYVESMFSPHTRTNTHTHRRAQINKTPSHTCVTCAASLSLPQPGVRVLSPPLYVRRG